MASPAGKWGEMTKRVLELHDQGLNRNQIAYRLGISNQAVHYHLTKLGKNPGRGKKPAA